MYIAFKWLFVMAVTMWMTLCWFHVFIKPKDICSTDLPTSINNTNNKTIKNETTITSKLYAKKTRRSQMNVLHYITFFAGAIAVTLYNKKRDIILLTKRKIQSLNYEEIIKYIKLIYSEIDLKTTAAWLWAAIEKIYSWLRVNLHILVEVLWHKINRKEGYRKLNILLLNKLRALTDERNYLAQLLVAVVEANRNIRMQYQLETFAKNRLVKHLEMTQKQIKENRTRYGNFQQLYLLTQEENTFLKSRLRKLTIEKDEIRNNLMRLMTKVFQSKNDELISFCGCFMLEGKNTTNTNTESQNRTHHSKLPLPSTSNWQINNEFNLPVSFSDSWPSTYIEELMPSENIRALLYSKPTPGPKGLSEDYVWTVKDKNCVIEKLYKYEFGHTNISNTDTIQKIRKYSVHHDKDCLLDFSCSSKGFAIVDFESKNSPGSSPDTSSSFTDPPLCLSIPSTHKIKAFSKPYQEFLKYSKNIMQSIEPPPMIDL